MGAVYPRVCGGSHGNSGPRNGPGGLSPRVRGKLEHHTGCAVCDGSIPACAGEAVRDIILVNHCRVYPRVCGGSR